MSFLLQLLTQLGINITALFQFGIFVTTVTFLSLYVFGPYNHAFTERVKRTKGGEADTAELNEKAVILHSEYEQKAREAHGHIAKVFQDKKMEVLSQTDKIVQGAREESQLKMEHARKSIASQVHEAQAQIKPEANRVALLVVQKMLGKA